MLASSRFRLQPHGAANATLSRRGDPRGQRQYLVAFPIVSSATGER